MIEYVREGRVPNFKTIFMILYKGKGRCVYMWKGVRNKGRRLRQVYKGNVETVSELYLFKKLISKSAHQLYKKQSEQMLVQV